MLCYLCGKKIGFPRSMVDQQYCSANHRREARLASSQALREEEDDLELWSVSKSKKKMARSATTAQTASIFAILTVGGLLVAALMMPGSGGGGGGTPSVALEPGTRQGVLQRAGNALGDMIRSSAPITFQTDFHTGLS